MWGKRGQLSLHMNVVERLKKREPVSKVLWTLRHIKSQTVKQIIKSDNSVMTNIELILPLKFDTWSIFIINCKICDYKKHWNNSCPSKHRCKERVLSAEIMIKTRNDPNTVTDNHKPKYTKRRRIFSEKWLRIAGNVPLLDTGGNSSSAACVVRCSITQARFFLHTSIIPPQCKHCAY